MCVRHESIEMDRRRWEAPFRGTTCLDTDVRFIIHRLNRSNCCDGLCGLLTSTVRHVFSSASKFNLWLELREKSVRMKLAPQSPPSLSVKEWESDVEKLVCLFFLSQCLDFSITGVQGSQYKQSSAPTRDSTTVLSSEKSNVN